MGQITFATPESEIVGSPGDFAYLPKSGRHAFRNDGDAPARALVVVAPGVAAHAFFEEVAVVTERGGGAAALAEAGARHGVAFLQPV